MDATQINDLRVAFEESLKSSKSASTRRSFMSYWKKIKNFEDKAQKYLVSGFTREDFVSLLSSMGPRSHGVLLNYIKSIKTYIIWLKESAYFSSEYADSQIELLESVRLDELNTPKKINDASSGNKLLYFKNLKTLWMAIEETVQVSGCYDITSLYPAICISVLLWYGFKEPEIIEIKKLDVLDTAVVNMRTKTAVKMDALSMEVLKKYKEAEGYYRLGRGAIHISYLASSFLFRSDRAEQLTSKNLRSALSRFSKYSSRKFSFESKAIYTSGLFNRICMKEFNGDFLIDDLSLEETAKCFELNYDGSIESKNKINGVLESYRAYKRYFLW